MRPVGIVFYLYEQDSLAAFVPWFEARLRRWQLRHGGHATNRSYYYGDPCVWCGRVPRRARQRTTEHVIPRAAGGGDHWENRALACRQCNTARRSAPLLAHLRRLRAGAPSTRAGSSC